MYFIAKMIQFYRMSFGETLKIPMNRFWKLYDQISVIESENYLALTTIAETRVWLKSDEGVERYEEYKKAHRENIKKSIVCNEIFDPEELKEKLEVFKKALG